MDTRENTKLNDFSSFDAATAVRAADLFGTPVYIYDEELILRRCRDCLEMPSAFGMTVRYAMKANSNRTLLKLITGAGLHLDASSLNEVLRAHMAGVPYHKIMLTTQEILQGEQIAKLEELLLQGLKYNACSLRQLSLIADFAAAHGIDPGIRVHPGIGSGESSTRNTGDDYACFGVHLSDVGSALELMNKRNLRFRHIHTHIGSGADSDMWRQNIDLELSIIEEYFPDAETVCFGGGLKEARMPDEESADIALLGNYAKEKIEGFFEKTGRKLKMEIEPGTYIVANSGYAVTRVIDKKSTSRSNFIIIDGGMEINSRPLLYGSRHPVYIISSGDAHVMSSEFSSIGGSYEAVVAGKCCESGDCQTLCPDGHSMTRAMAEPEIGDVAVIGGVGAYCSSMAPFNYNSHAQVPEVLYMASGDLKLIRRRQTLEQILENEL
ncbi:MAG: diaminopimelate decarboxylase [Oscillospiraceae bacterium]|nr:diaminopimelate decarboxylase [Oscillospiraceae bacterium]